MNVDWDDRCTPTVFVNALMKDFHLSTALCEEIMSQNLPEVMTLLKAKNANPNIVLPERGVAPFHLLVGLENEEFSVPVALTMLRYGGDPNVRSDEGLTPVHVAAMWGRCKVLEQLLSNGGDPFLIDFKLFLAAEDYALKEQQWRAYAVLACFEVDGQKRLVDQEGESEESGTTVKKLGTEDWVRQMEGAQLANSAIQTIKSHRRNAHIYEHPDGYTNTVCRQSRSSRNKYQLPLDYSDSEVVFTSEKCTSDKNIHPRIRSGAPTCDYDSEVSLHKTTNQPLNSHRTEATLYRHDEESTKRVKRTSSKPNRRKHVPKYTDDTSDCGGSHIGPKVPKRNDHNWKHKSEEYFCGYAESSFENRRYSSGIYPLGTPNNKMLCKLSRIFLFILNKRQIYQSVKQKSV